VVLNDVFDAELDKKERPERPIPSGTIRKSTAAFFGTILLVLGIAAACLVHERLLSLSTVLAITIAIAAVIYDKWGKHLLWIGPVNMGLCRGLNLLLGMSILPAAVGTLWYLAVVPIVYIAAITSISRGEVYGARTSTLQAAVFMYSAVVLSILAFAWYNSNLLASIAFLALFAIMIMLPLFKAIKQPTGPLVGKSVKAGVLALILMNAAWAAAAGFVPLAFAIMLLLPFSLLLAKLFAVT
jgi:4-hydroxybenzoate polyprenyltransferase